MRIEDLEHCEKFEDGKRMMVSELRDNAIILRMFVKIGSRWKANETMLVTRAMFPFVVEQIALMNTRPEPIKFSSASTSLVLDTSGRETCGYAGCKNKATKYITLESGAAHVCSKHAT